MILVSKRCFLNVLTQLWTPDKLLYANYYVADQRTETGLASLQNSMGYNEYGQLTIDESGITPLGSCYNIKVSTCIDPEPYKVISLMADDKTPQERYIEYLNHPETLINTYNFLFKEPLKGNGIQIVLLNDDENMFTFGHIIAQYLSMNFGVDIIFIDSQYVTKCEGLPAYQGNIENAQKIIKQVRDWSLLFDFNQALSQTSSTHNINNLSVYLSSFEFDDLMYLYHLIFPQAPLPPGNYTLEYVRDLLIQQATQNMDLSGEPILPNLFSWSEVVSRSEQEELDFADDEIID